MLMVRAQGNLCEAHKIINFVKGIETFTIHCEDGVVLRVPVADYYGALMDKFPSGKFFTTNYALVLPGSMDMLGMKSEAGLETLKELQLAQETPTQRCGIGMTFGEALEALKEGKIVARSGFGAVSIKAQFPDEHSKMTQPYLYQELGDPDEPMREPWVPNQHDMFASDWFVLLDGAEKCPF